jgi:hypothetical protein
MRHRRLGVSVKETGRRGGVKVREFAGESESESDGKGVSRAKQKKE